LLAACAGSLVWGLKRRQFAFVAYAAVYGYVRVSSMLLRNTSDGTTVLAYFVITAIAMIVMLVHIARHFGRPE
jgi:FtsH-binding integral membrane protein